METLINEILLRLDKNLDTDNLANLKQTLYSVLNDYNITKKETLPVLKTDPIPDELKYYMVSKKIEGLSEGTIEQYWYCLKDLFETLNKPVAEVTVADLRLYLYNYQKNHNVSDNTLNIKRLYIHSFFEWLVLNGYIQKNPCSLINTIKYDKKERQPLSDLEMEQLKHACAKYNEKAIVELLYSTGCRVSELINLKFDDIDFDRREVHLYGKGKKERTAYLNARAIVALDEYIKNKNKPSEYVFSSRVNPSKHITARAVECMIKALGEKAGISDKVFPHRIRHTTATDALSRGMQIEQVQTLLGHEKTSTTLIYAKVNQSGVKNESLRCIV